MEEPTVSGPSERFLAAVGGLTINWAVIETALDFCVAIVFRAFDGRKIGNGEVPRSLSRKITFLKKGMRHPKLKEIGAYADDLLELIETQKERRHEVVHGAVSGKYVNADKIDMLRVGYEKHGHRTSMHEVTTDDVLAANEAAFGLTDPAVVLGIRLFNIAYPKDAIDYAGR